MSTSNTLSAWVSRVCHGKISIFTVYTYNIYILYVNSIATWVDILWNGLNISHPSIRIFISNSTTVSFWENKHPEEKALEKIRQDVMNQLARCVDWKKILKTTKCRCEKCGEAKRSYLGASEFGREPLGVGNIEYPIPNHNSELFLELFLGRLGQWGNIRAGSHVGGALAPLP